MVSGNVQIVKYKYTDGHRLIIFCRHNPVNEHLKYNEIQSIYTVSGMVPLYFWLELSHFLVDFYNFYIIENRNKYFTTACNL